MTTYITHTLSNGLRVALLPTRSKVVYCGFAIRSGSYDDPKDYPGLAHFVEHMLFKGTEHRKAWHVINRMELVGGELNAYTTKDNTFVYTSAPRNELIRSVELLNDIIRHSTFPQREIEKERVVVADEINLYKDSPSEQIYDDFEEYFFADPAMGHPILGNNRSLMRMNSDTCRSYAREAFVPEKMVFFCMGQITERKFLQLMESHLSEPFDKSSSLEQTRDRKIEINRFDKRIKTRTHQAHTLLGGRAPNLIDPDRTEASVLLNILAGSGMNSRLNLRLREQKGWVYGVESGLSILPDTGWWQIYFGSDPTHALPALEATLNELDLIRTNSLTPTGLRAWLKQIKGQAAMATENSESTFLNFGRQLLLKGYYDDLGVLHKRLSGVTMESLHRVAKTLFDPSNISTFVYEGKE